MLSGESRIPMLAGVTHATLSIGNGEKRHPLRITYLGKADYGETLKLQRILVEDRAEARIPDTLLLVEHNPVITVGRAGRPAHILASRESLTKRGIALYEVERGGDVTYHGPGQIVGYPIVRLSDGLRGVVPYVRNLEEVLIRALKTFGVTAYRRPGLTGVWTDQGKVAAIGVSVRRLVTFHGFALNVNTDLSHFELIIPCGLPAERVTSLSRILGRPLTMAKVVQAVVTAFMDVFKAFPENPPEIEVLPHEWNDEPAS